MLKYFLSEIHSGAPPSRIGEFGEICIIATNASQLEPHYARRRWGLRCRLASVAGIASAPLFRFGSLAGDAIGNGRKRV